MEQEFHGSLQLTMTRRMMTTMKEKAFNVFREHFPDLTLEYIPGLSTPHEYVWEIFSKWGCSDVGGRESNAVLMRWTKNRDTIALGKKGVGGTQWIENHNNDGDNSRQPGFVGNNNNSMVQWLGSAIQTCFPETSAVHTSTGRGTIAFIFAFPNGDTLMQRARGYNEGTEICEFPFFVKTRYWKSKLKPKFSISPNTVFISN
jgi:hypothetical protein